MTNVSQALQQVVDRIVAEAHPLKLILFGSAAREEMIPTSDIDILVVMPEGTSRRKTAQHLQTKMFVIPFAVDIIVATPSDLERHRENIGLIYRAVLREGREIYAAA